MDPATSATSTATSPATGPTDPAWAQDPDPELRVFSVTEVAQRLRVSEIQVRRMISDGRLRAVRVGSAVRIPVTVLRDLLGEARGE